MDERPVAQAARTEIEHAFADEEIQNIGWEEFAFDDVEAEWKIKIGFRRPWRAMAEPQPAVRLLRPDRSCELVRVRDEDGSIVAVTDRMLTLVE